VTSPGKSTAAPDTNWETAENYFSVL